MSDNWNQPPGSDPADDQPNRPPEHGPGQNPHRPSADDQGPGQGQGAPGESRRGPATSGPRQAKGGPGNGQGGQSWWIGDTDAKREFQNPSQAEPPANNWFAGGWNPTRREHPDQPADPNQPVQGSAPGRPGPGQRSPQQSGPQQSGPQQSRPQQSGPARPGPNQSGPNQSGPNRPGPNQPGRQHRGPQQSGPNQSGPNQPGPRQSGPNQPGPNQGGSGRPGPSQPSPWQSGPPQVDPWQTNPTPSTPQSDSFWSQSAPTPQNPKQSGPDGPSQPSSPQSGASQAGASWSAQSWTLRDDSAGDSESQHESSEAGSRQSGQGWSATAQSGSSAWQAAPSQPPQRDQSGPRSEDSYLWGPANQSQQPTSPWSNALSPQQQAGPRHAASQGGPGQIGPMGQPVQQGPNWQYPPIPIPQPPGGRRRRKKKVSRNLLILLVALAVLVVGSGITLLIRSVGGGDDPQAKDSPTAPVSESSSSPSESPSTSPSPSTPRGPTADEVVKGSALYKVGPVAASKCAEPPFAPVTVPAAQQYYNRLLPCLNRTWWLAMKKANLPFRNPKAVVYVGKTPSPCGIQRSVRAAYCGANETIYLPFSVDNGYYRTNPVYARAVMLNTFAHEYGHHVQKLSGILASSMSRQQSMTPNQKLLESRRRELQATCLGAVYLGANAAFTPMNGPLLANWKFLISHSGDDYARPRVHDHGNRVSNYQWSISGFNSKKPDACNTFTAADVRVN